MAVNDKKKRVASTAETKAPAASTSTERQIRHLTALAANEGQRLVVDLDKDRLDKINGLMEAGYGTSKAAVIRKAIDDAHARAKRKKD
jgi:hypothetical protein